MAKGDSRGAQGSRRPRQQTRRCYRVEFTLTEQEYAALEDAAKRTELARGAYAAQVVLAHVNGSGTGPEAPGREALLELVRGRAGPQDRGPPQPGGDEAERDRAALG